MDFLYLLRVLLKRKWLILGVGLTAAVIAWALTMNQEKKYRSFMQFSTGFTVNDEVRVSPENVDLYAADVKFDNVRVTVLSPSSSACCPITSSSTTSKVRHPSAGPLPRIRGRPSSSPSSRVTRS